MFSPVISRVCGANRYPVLRPRNGGPALIQYPTRRDSGFLLVCVISRYASRNVNKKLL